MSDDDPTPVAEQPGDRPFQPPYAGSPLHETPRVETPGFGDPRGYRPSFSYPSEPTMPPPAPPSWLPPQGPDTIAGPGGGSGHRPRRGLGLVAGLAALVIVSAGVGGVAGWSVSDNNTNNSSAAAASSATPTPAASTGTIGAAPQTISSGSGTPKSYAAIAAAVLPVVVSIDVRTSSEGDTGSGIIISADGYILTNNHVVTAASTSGTITVHFNDGTSTPGKIVGTDLSSDLAVVKVQKTGLPVAHLGSSAGVRVGDAVLAVGSPLGLSGTVTSGIVSALNRPVDTTADQEQQQQPTNPFDPFGNNSAAPSQAPTTATTATVFGAIQTDAAINPGNSGGALVDDQGNVIGINSAIASLGATSGSTQSGSIGVGFAIPIDLAKYVAQQLIATGHATHAQIGVSVGDNVNNSTGATTVVVQQVNPGTPGAKAGLLKGDIITKIDSTIATDEDTLIATIRSHRPGDKVTLTISRAGVTKTVTLTLGASAS
jgi:putative serine protease PepD